MHKLLFLMATIGTISPLLPARAQDAKPALQIAAASDLVYCLEDLNKAYKESHPNVDLKVSSGSSGNFFAQIKNGGPFDLFLSADIEYPRQLIKAGLADEGTLTMYAVGRLALWTTKEIDLAPGLAVVKDAKVTKVSIANPEHAPYGRAAKAALEHEKLWDGIQGKLVLGENISQAAQYVETGNADVGVVALSLVLSPRLAKVGKWVEIPESLYPRLEQGAIITKKGETNPAAKEYLAFLRSPEARTIFDRYGFRLPAK